MLELRDLSKLLFGVLDSLVNELVSELETGLVSGLNARDWVNSDTEESCLTIFSGIDTYLNHHETCIIHIYILHSRSQLNSGLTTLFLN